MSASDWPVEVDPVFGCWLWTDELTHDGYGLQGRRVAHRVVYEHEVGPIPDGMVGDHECRRRRCCFPGHLAIVTQEENLRRRRWGRRISRRACPNGHERLHAVVTPEGGVLCRMCMKRKADLESTPGRDTPVEG